MGTRIVKHSDVEYNVRLTLPGYILSALETIADDQDRSVQAEIRQILKREIEKNNQRKN